MFRSNTDKGSRTKAKRKTNEFAGLTNQQLLVAWLGRHELNRKMRLALKKEMRVRRVRTGGFLEL